MPHLFFLGLSCSISQSIQAVELKLGWESKIPDVTVNRNNMVVLSDSVMIMGAKSVAPYEGMYDQQHYSTMFIDPNSGATVSSFPGSYQDAFRGINIASVGPWFQTRGNEYLRANGNWYFFFR